MTKTKRNRGNNMIVLASASPRRKELLNLVCSDFIIEPSDIDETVKDDIELSEYPQYLATQKAEAVFFNGHTEDIVIGCDTGVFIDDKMLGKPQSESEATEMLQNLSGKTHSVITGCCVISKDKKVSFSQTTFVEFYPLSSDEIARYVRTKEPMDKAGAYGIQGEGALLVKEIKGDYFNVVGLPIAKLNQVLKEF